MRLALLLLLCGLAAQAQTPPEATPAPTPSASPSPITEPATPAPSPSAPQPSASPASTGDADLDYARQFGAVVLDTLYSGEYATVVDMMNPDPPLWKGSKEALRKARSGDLAQKALNRASYGLRLSLDCPRFARVPRPDRPASEEYFELLYRSTYGDHLIATDLLVVMKKDGKFYVERFK